jgi:2-oxoglutarate ferredoxin oxidoreductase subunit delta
MAKGHVVIQEEQCKGCLLCTLACPQQVLVMNAQTLNGRGYHPVQFVDPQNKCTGCALCAVVCPDTCFTVFKHQAVPINSERVYA